MQFKLDQDSDCEDDDVNEVHCEFDDTEDDFVGLVGNRERWDGIDPEKRRSWNFHLTQREPKSSF